MSEDAVARGAGAGRHNPRRDAYQVMPGLHGLHGVAGMGMALAPACNSSCAAMASTEQTFSWPGSAMNPGHAQPLELN